MTTAVQHTEATVATAYTVLQQMKWRLEKARTFAQANAQLARERNTTDPKTEADLQRIAQHDAELEALFDLLHAANNMAVDHTYYQENAYTEGFSAGLIATNDPLALTPDELAELDYDTLVTIGNAQTWRLVFPSINSATAMFYAEQYGNQYIDLLINQTRNR